MNKDELQVADVEEAMRGQGKLIPLANGEWAQVWRSKNSLHLRILPEDVIIEMGFTPGEGAAVKTPQ